MCDKFLGVFLMYPHLKGRLGQNSCFTWRSTNFVNALLCKLLTSWIAIADTSEDKQEHLVK
jgi:hypothetical protein